MSIGDYKIRNQHAIHFLTLTVVDWVDVFTRKAYKDIIIDNMRYCQHHKGLVPHAWCIMSNHLHLISSANENNLGNILRDFKKFTSKQIIEAIRNNQQESRRAWMLKIFKEHGQRNTRNSDYQFWQQENHPEECYSPAFTVQKLTYTHNNPVEAGIVLKPEDYLYSSTRDYHYRISEGRLELVFL